MSKLASIRMVRDHREKVLRQVRDAAATTLNDGAAAVVLASSERADPKYVKSCNQGYWRADLLRTNGFDERMQGWGREDDELAARLFTQDANVRNVKLHFATRRAKFETKLPLAQAQ